MSGSGSNFQLDYNEVEVTSGGAHSNTASAPATGGGGSGTVTNIATGTGLTGGPITTSGTISIAPVITATGPIGDATHVAQVTVNAEGQVTALSAVLITGGGGAPSGPAGGDLAGTYPNPTVAQIQTIPVSDVGGAVAFVNPGGAGLPATQMGSSLPLYLSGNWPTLGFNAENNGSGWIFGAGSSTSGNGDFAGFFQQRMNQSVANGAFAWQVSNAAGNAAAALNFNTIFCLYPNGHMVFGVAPTNSNPLADDGINMLQVNGSARISSLTSGYVVGDASGNLSTVGAISGLLPTGGAIYQALKKTSATNYAVGWFGPDWFNAGDYGTIQAAVTACCAAGGGGVFIPSGTWNITAAITLTAGFTGRLTIRGAGRFATVIVAGTAAQNGFNLDLSSGNQQSVVSVEDLALHTANGVAAGTAIYIKQAYAASSENQGGCVVRGIEIWSNSNSQASGNTDGWTNGINLVNTWHAKVIDVYGYGNATNFAAGSPIGSGSAGAGSGAFLQIASGTSNSFTDVSADFWGQGLRINYVSGTTSPQGTVLTGFNFVSTVEAVHVYGASGNGIDGLMISNGQFDNGNNSLSANALLILAYAGNVCVSNLLGVCAVGVALQFSNCNGIRFSSSTFTASSLAGNFMTLASQTQLVAGDDVYLPGPITIDASSGLSSLSNIAGATITDSGSGNLVGRIALVDVVVALTATATQNFNVNISAAKLGKAASNVVAQVIGPLGTTKVTAVFDAASGSNSATNAVMTAYCYDLSTPAATNYQFLFQVFP